MDISRLMYLKGEAEKCSLGYDELIEIEAEFDKIPDEELREVRENALADDMLDEIEARMSHVGGEYKL